MRFFWLAFIIVTVNVLGIDNSPKKLVDLNGYWKFEIGDNLDWADPSYDDSRWERIRVPSTWEDEGFPGYDGFAWYRITFTLESYPSSHPLYLKLGAIDDVDEVYLNGHFIGYSGNLPPNYSTSAHHMRTYTISNDFINYNGKNVLAIRVYDGGGVGGISYGDSHISRYYEEFEPEINLAGSWKFKKGDRDKWKSENYNDENWQDVSVPTFWCAYGLKLYDGFAWYRKSFRIPESLHEERLILLLGEIDDMDETYINGNLIGHTGDIKDYPAKIELNDSDYRTLRAYYIQNSILHFNQENTIAVRVYDGIGYGGIYDGPIGIITRDQYISLKRKIKKESKRNFFEWLFGDH